MKKLSKEEQQQIFEDFYKIETKDQQDSHLQGLMEIKPIERSRPRAGTVKENTKGKKHSIKYNFSTNGKKIHVCKKAILVLYSISNKRLRRISTLLAVGKSPKDMRGTNLKTHAIPGETCQNIKDHIESFPTKMSHYTGQPITYLSADLTIKTMYKLFINKYPNCKVKYSFYYTYYKENFNYRFGRPQKDVCGKCEELSTKIKSNTLNDNAKRVAVAEKMVHLRRAKNFYSALQDITRKCVDEPDTYGICVDFMQNLPLPHIPVQEIFYYRQLWVNCFCIYDFKTKKSKIYLYHEGIAKKGGNEVSSFLYNFIQNMLPETAKEIHVFSDGCIGQNRNHTVLRTLLGLSVSRKISVTQYFPVRGHSFLPCDRTFGVIKRCLKKSDRVYTPMQYEKMITESSDGKIETVLLQDSEIILNFDKWWPKYFKKCVASTESLTTAKNKKDRNMFKISEFYYFTMNNGDLTAYNTIKGLVKQTFRLKKPNVRELTFPNEKAFTGKNPINLKKIEDIKKVLSMCRKNTNSSLTL